MSSPSEIVFSAFLGVSASRPVTCPSILRRAVSRNGAFPGTSRHTSLQCCYHIFASTVSPFLCTWLDHFCSTHPASIDVFSSRMWRLRSWILIFLIYACIWCLSKLIRFMIFTCCHVLAPQPMTSSLHDNLQLLCFSWSYLFCCLIRRSCHISAFMMLHPHFLDLSSSFLCWIHDCFPPAGF